jgi:drug/metabolite transporter (DMT)-like permease
MSAIPLPARLTDNARRGIIYMMATIFIFAIINLFVKSLLAVYPVTEVALFRAIFSTIPLAVLLAANGGLAAIRTKRLADHGLRAAVQFAGLLCAFMALAHMPLADYTAISFSTPLFVTALSVPFLGERVGIYRWSAVLVGFVGVLIMAQPNGEFLREGVVFAIANAVLNAGTTIALRRMTATESSTTLVFYQITFTIVFALACLPFGWVTPSWIDLCSLAAIGLGSGVGQYWWTQAYRYAPAAVAAPFTYTSMIWAMLFGYLVWGDLPTVSLVIGAVIVTASGLYILYREVRRQVQKSAMETAGE